MRPRPARYQQANAGRDDPALLARAPVVGRFALQDGQASVVVRELLKVGERDLCGDDRIVPGDVGLRVSEHVLELALQRHDVDPKLIREDTPLANPFWDYSRNKIACEERLMRAYREDGFPVTIVRPSLTYGDTQVPLCMNSWALPYTAIARMRLGKPLIVPGDGTSLWTMTHNSDFAVGLVGLLGRRQAIGHAFNIMSDEVLTWDEIYRQTAAAAGVEARIVHIASDFIAACMPEMTGTLVGDKAGSAVFDTTKIKRFVPDFRAVTPYAEGIRRTIAWFDADPARQQVDPEMDARWDRLIAAYEQGLTNAVAAFAEGT